MNKKYTASEWAMIEGGHTLEDGASPSFGFIREELNESTMYRTRAQAETANETDVADFAFVTLITLWLLYNNKDTRNLARNYATQTIQYRDFNHYRRAGTDLYMAIHRLVNAGKLNEREILRFLTMMSGNQQISSPESWLLTLERQLKINNSAFKMMRRNIADWKTINDSQHELVYNKLLLYYRAKAIRSELYSIIENLAKNHDLKIAKAKGSKVSRHTSGFKLGQEIHRPLV